MKNLLSEFNINIKIASFGPKDLIFLVINNLSYKIQLQDLNSFELHKIDRFACYDDDDDVEKVIRITNTNKIAILNPERLSILDLVLETDPTNISLKGVRFRDSSFEDISYAIYKVSFLKVD